LSIRRFYSLEVKFLWRKDECAAFIVDCYIGGGFVKEILLLFVVRGTGTMCFPSSSLHIAITKPAMKTFARGTSFLWLDLWRPTDLLRGFEVFLTLDM